MNKVIVSLLATVLFALQLNGQTTLIKGDITSYKGDNGRVYLGVFEGSAIAQKSSATISQAGHFELSLSTPVHFCEGFLWFETGDTISFIIGEPQLQFKARYYEHLIIEPQFP